MHLLDPSFRPPFLCRCDMVFGSNAHWCECLEQTLKMEEQYGCRFHSYEIEYDGQIISRCRELIPSIQGSDNLLTGCVR